MKKETKGLIILLIHLVLTISISLFSIYALVSFHNDLTSINDLLFKVCCLLGIAGLILSFIYFLVGYKKNAYKYYRVFMLINTVEIIISTLLFKTLPFYIILLNLVAFSMIIFLALAKDLGKAKSRVLSIVLVVSKAIMFAYYYIQQYTDYSLFILLACELMLAATAALMVAGKYFDKDLRGAK